MEIQREVPSLPEYFKYSIFKVSNYTAGLFAATAADIRQRVKSITLRDMSMTKVVPSLLRSYSSWRNSAFSRTLCFISQRYTSACIKSFQ